MPEPRNRGCRKTLLRSAFSPTDSAFSEGYAAFTTRSMSGSSTVTQVVAQLLFYLAGPLPIRTKRSTLDAFVEEARRSEIKPHSDDANNSVTRATCGRRPGHARPAPRAGAKGRPEVNPSSWSSSVRECRPDIAESRMRLGAFIDCLPRASSSVGRKSCALHRHFRTAPEIPAVGLRRPPNLTVLTAAATGNLRDTLALAPSSPRSWW